MAEYQDPVSSPGDRSSYNMSKQPLGFEPMTAEYDTEQEHHVRPETLDNVFVPTKLVYRLFDLLIAVMALLFAIFAFEVRRLDGTSADPDSPGHRLYKIAQIGPTIYPLLFAAVVGGSMKSLATWKIQTRRGATVKEIEQYMGSQTVSNAVLTQLNLRAFNFLGILIVFLWSFSPVGSQASLRVISITTDSSYSSAVLYSIQTFSWYQYGLAEGISEATTILAGPLVASLSAATLLGSRNQDLWGNVRIPSIERLIEDGDPSTTDWMAVPTNDNLTYPSLVGIPLVTPGSLSNTSVILPASYLALSCPHFGPAAQATNFTSNPPDPGNGNDSSWLHYETGFQFQIAISTPPHRLDPLPNTTRNARRLFWESSLGNTDTLFRCECDITTTYVESNVACSQAIAGDSSNTSSNSVCSVSSVRRVDNPLNRNWTVLDLNSGVDGGGLLYLITSLFPYAGPSGTVNPIVTYLKNPYGLADSFDFSLQGISQSTLEIRLAQILNSALYLGISPAAFTGGFNRSDFLQEEVIINATGINTVNHEVIRCNEVWFWFLVLSSFVLFVCAIGGAALRLIVIVPDILGTISVAFLDNRTRGIVGNSAWSSSKWGREFKDARLCLVDVSPGEEIGRLALVNSSMEGTSTGSVITRGRHYM